MEQRRVRLFQWASIIVLCPTIVLLWMHIAFDSFAATRWYEPLIAGALVANVVLQAMALAYQRRARTS